MDPAHGSSPKIAGSPSTREVLASWSPVAPEDLANPYRAYALARREAPVFYNEFFRAWVVTRHADLTTALRDTKRFTSRHAMHSGEVPAALQDRLPFGYPWTYPGLSNQDPPEHTRVRKLANESFKPHVIAEREAEITEIVDALIDDFVSDGVVEFVSGFANRLPVRVACLLLDIPESHVDDVFRWTDDMLVLFSNPGLAAEERLRRAEGMAEYDTFLNDFIDERRERPGSDLMSRMIDATNATVEGEPFLSQLELVSIFAQIVQAATDTVSRLLGLMVLRLLEHPDQLNAVLEEPALAAAAVEETLRHSTSNLGLMRQTTEDVELGDVTIPEGEDVVLLFASGNHDESIFACPEHFDIHRGDVDRHLAFGKYAHFCIGAPLARLEARVSLQRLLARLPNLRRANDALEWTPVALHMALERLDLAWDV